MVPRECVPKGNPTQGSYRQERSKHSCGVAGRDEGQSGCGRKAGGWSSRSRGRWCLSPGICPPVVLEERRVCWDWDCLLPLLPRLGVRADSETVLPKCQALCALGRGQNPLSSHSTHAFLISCLASGLCLPVFSILTAQESTAQMQMDNRRLAPARGKRAHSPRRPLLKDAFLAPPATYTSLAQQVSHTVSKSSPSGLPVGLMGSDCHIFRRFKFTTKSSALPLKHTQCLRHGWCTPLFSQFCETRTSKQIKYDPCISILTSVISLCCKFLCLYWCQINITKYFFNV